MSAISVFATVTVAALAGMVLGGLFGLAARLVAPDFFRFLVPWEQLEPVGTGIVLGAFGGVMCGGLLGGFAVAAQLAANLISRRLPGDKHAEI